MKKAVHSDKISKNGVLHAEPIWECCAIAVTHRLWGIVHMLTVQIWECGKVGSRSGTLDSDGPAHLVPLMEG